MLAGYFDSSDGHLDSPRSTRENRYNKKHDRAISHCWPMDVDRRRREVGGKGVYVPALIGARKGPMAALGSLVAKQAVQAVALERAPTAVVHGPAPAALRGVDEASGRRSRPLL